MTLLTFDAFVALSDEARRQYFRDWEAAGKFVHMDDGYVCDPCGCSELRYHCICGVNADGSFQV